MQRAETRRPLPHNERRRGLCRSSAVFLLPLLLLCGSWFSSCVSPWATGIVVGVDILIVTLSLGPLCDRSGWPQADVSCISDDPNLSPMVPGVIDWHLDKDLTTFTLPPLAFRAHLLKGDWTLS